MERGFWTTPRVAPFSGRYSDVDPFVSPDGTRLFFSSIRPVGGAERRDADLWVVERRGETWGEPVHLGDGVNSRYDELYPSVDARGVLYFGSDRDFIDGVGWDIFRARPNDGGTYGPAEPLPAGVKSDAWNYNPTITKDGSTLIFVSRNRDGRFGAGDIFISRLAHTVWTPAQPLGERVNTLADEFHPSLSPDERTLFFVRREGSNDLFRVAWPGVKR